MSGFRIKYPPQGARYRLNEIPAPSERTSPKSIDIGRVSTRQAEKSQWSIPPNTETSHISENLAVKYQDVIYTRMMTIREGPACRKLPVFTAQKPSPLASIGTSNVFALYRQRSMAAVAKHTFELGRVDGHLARTRRQAPVAVAVTVRSRTAARSQRSAPTRSLASTSSRPFSVPLTVLLTSSRRSDLRPPRSMLRWVRAWPTSNMLLVSTTRIISRWAAPPSIWTPFRCQSAQEIVRYPLRISRRTVMLSRSPSAPMR